MTVHLKTAHRTPLHITRKHIINLILSKTNNLTSIPLAKNIRHIILTNRENLPTTCDIGGDGGRSDGVKLWQSVRGGCDGESVDLFGRGVEID